MILAFILYKHLAFYIIEFLSLPGLICFNTLIILFIYSFEAERVTMHYNIKPSKYLKRFRIYHSLYPKLYPSAPKGTLVFTAPQGQKGEKTLTQNKYPWQENYFVGLSYAELIILGLLIYIIGLIILIITPLLELLISSLFKFRRVA